MRPDRQSSVQLADVETPADASTANSSPFGAVRAGQAFISFNRSSSTRNVSAQSTLAHQDGPSTSPGFDAAGRQQDTGVSNSSRDTPLHAADNKDADAGFASLVGAHLQISRPQQLVCSSIKHANTFMRSNFDHLSSIREGSKDCVGDDFGPSPFHSLQMSSDASAASLDDGEFWTEIIDQKRMGFWIVFMQSIGCEFGTVHQTQAHIVQPDKLSCVVCPCPPDCVAGVVSPTRRDAFYTWRSTFKQTSAYQLLVCIGPLITGQMLAIAYAKTSNAVSWGAWQMQHGATGLAG